RIHGERVCPVPPLDVPDEGGGDGEAMNASAVQLFAARARAADPRFPLDARRWRALLRGSATRSAA
ncbi:hypothetical protein QM306_36605, partial [Burkholderia cenocepacia]|nr:hypothetical protein [Burkholderia cenocepacia]